MRREVRAAGIAVLLMLSACANGRSTMEGFEDRPTKIGLTVADSRPDKDKTSENLSLWVTSCSYGIRRLGDETSSPSRLILLRHDLEDALGARLTGTTVTVSRYRVFWNGQAGMVAANPYGHGLVGALLNPNCTKEQTGDGFYMPSEAPLGYSPLIVEIEASFGGKTYAVRTVHGPAAEFRVTEPTQEMFLALHQANAALIEQIRRP